MYRTTVQPLVSTLFANGKATCFAYGQTGSGKTFTMSPLPIRAAADLLQYLARPQWADVSLFVSCFEIYGNKVSRVGGGAAQHHAAAGASAPGGLWSAPAAGSTAVSSRSLPCSVLS